MNQGPVMTLQLKIKWAAKWILFIVSSSGDDRGQINTVIFGTGRTDHVFFLKKLDHLAAAASALGDSQNFPSTSVAPKAHHSLQSTSF